MGDGLFCITIPITPRYNMADIDLRGSPHFPEWLGQSGFSLALTTYQTNRLLLLGSNGDGTFSGFERLFDRPMGLSASEDGEHITMATRYQIRELTNVLSPDETHEGYDRVYVPRRAHTIGELDAHDLCRTAGGNILFVNTRFSCVATPSDTHSFRPVWTPPFLSEISPEDRCHLNGLALEGGQPRYATAVSQSDVAAGWRDRREGSGVVIDVKTGDTVAEGLTMPHSPHLRDGDLYLINAGTGDFGRVDLETGQFEPIAFVPGFGRGLAFRNGHAIVGLSEPRGDEVFQDLPLGRRLEKKDAAPRCGLFVVDLDTGTAAHWLTFSSVISELYDVQVLPGTCRPMALGFKTDEIQRFVTIEQEEGTQRFLLTPDSPGASDADDTEMSKSEANRAAAADASMFSFELPGETRRGTRIESNQPYRLHTGQMAAEELLRRFGPLLPNRFQQRVATGQLSSERPLLGVVASCGDEPVGLTAADQAQSPALLRALGVLPAHRGQGLGTRLLEGIERLCKESGVGRLEAEYRGDLKDRVSLERLFEKRGWSRPEVHRHLFKVAVSDAVKHPELQRREPPAGDIFPWSEMSRTEHRRVKQKVQDGDLPPLHSPLQMTDAIEAASSIALGTSEGVLGWIVAHRLADDLLQYTSLYVERSVRRQGIGLALITEAAHRQHERTDVPNALWTIESENVAMMTCVEEHLSPVLTSHVERWRTEKVLSGFGSDQSDSAV